MRIVYGPVASWRLGRSPGIDPLGGTRKRCTFDCPYCPEYEYVRIRDENTEYGRNTGRCGFSGFTWLRHLSLDIGRQTGGPTCHCDEHRER